MARLAVSETRSAWIHTDSPMLADQGLIGVTPGDDRAWSGFRPHAVCAVHQLCVAGPQGAAIGSSVALRQPKRGDSFVTRRERSPCRRGRVVVGEGDSGKLIDRNSNGNRRQRARQLAGSHK